MWIIYLENIFGKKYRLRSHSWPNLDEKLFHKETMHTLIAGLMHGLSRLVFIAGYDSIDGTHGGGVTHSGHQDIVSETLGKVKYFTLTMKSHLRDPLGNVIRSGLMG